MRVNELNQYVMVLDQYALVYGYLLYDVTNNKEGFIYEKRHSIDKSLYQEVSSSSSLRSPIDRDFGKGIVFCEFRLQFI